MTDPLLQAVRNLTLVVDRLEKTLREEYPKRAEIERRFATRKEQAQKRRTWVLSIMLMIFISGFLSFFATISTVSICFLSTDARAGSPPVACNVLPGFEDAVVENQKLMKQFEKLVKMPGENDRRLDRIEKRLGIQ